MARNRPSTQLVVVHCAATRRHQDVGVETIDKWHRERGIFSPRGPSGYHYVIRRSGATELGRDLPAMGAHALGFNDESVALCLVGGVNKDLEPEDNFEPAQKRTLEAWIRVLLTVYPDALVIPHYAISTKACPSFDVWAWQQEVFGHNDELRFKKWKAHQDQEVD
jgi:N-acetylmuramoyl-L-alanine amidase